MNDERSPISSRRLEAPENTFDPATDELVSDLSAHQREAVLHTEGPLLVLAGPGSGKTRVITYRIVHLITQAGVRPDQVLAVTFTNKAAEEMRNSVEALLGADCSKMRVSTYHSL